MKKLLGLLLFLCFVTVSEAQVISFPDANFKAKLLEANASNTIAKNIAGSFFKIDTNSDNEIQLSEALEVSFLQVSSSDIQSLQGIVAFSNLKYLNCWYNILGDLNLDGLSNLIELNCFESNITSLSLNGLTGLKILDCHQNQIQSLNVQDLTSITTLNCRNNQLTSLDVSNLSMLTTLYCNYNDLTNLNLDNLFNLNYLYCMYNELTNLDTSDLTNLVNLYCEMNDLVSLNLTSSTLLSNLDCSNNLLNNLNLSGLTSLYRLYCGANQLTTLDVSSLTGLVDFRCSWNQLEVIDISNLRLLNILDCYGNNLRYLYLKNGRSNMTLNFGANPNLLYACIDESLVSWIQNLCVNFGCNNCNVNSYCSFVPGGVYRILQGNSKYDNFVDGCDSSDPVFPRLKLSVSSGANSGNYISDENGDYFIPLQNGNHILTPVLENPTYFNISPSSILVSFPSQSSPFIQNFCITPNGIHQDLEVSIIPLSVARPGFDATYQIIYKNKGNMSQFGTIALSYEDDLMDLVSSTPTNTVQSFGLLSWDYSNLLPYETRTIEVKMNVNSPMETPAVNIGDQLDFTTTINPMSGDEYLPDNTKSLKQIVVGSLDPNDKTCLEGNTVGQEMIGQYVHYVIRFENTGTFAAENIVVKDMIDLTKFDLSSLIPISASHSFVTRIANNGKVEFIFENIQLPFDDASNDGYIAFKIKTKPTLVVGDTFTNNASIYFDYNFPIETNIASTTIQVLGNQDFEFSNYFSLFPNPASDVLNIQIKNAIELNSVSIYNTLGQLVLVIPEVSQIDAIDVSNLRTGSYFIKLITDKGITSSKFFKK